MVVFSEQRYKGKLNTSKGLCARGSIRKIILHKTINHTRSFGYDVKIEFSFEVKHSKITMSR